MDVSFAPWVLYPWGELPVNIAVYVPLDQMTGTPFLRSGGNEGEHLPADQLSQLVIHQHSYSLTLRNSCSLQIVVNRVVNRSI